MNRRTFVSSSFSLAAPLGLAGQTGGANPGEPNEAIERARQNAINVLNPSQQQLEHGLRLHAGSLVFESYGFSPRMAMDGDAVKAAIEAGASDLELEDMREEMMMTRAVDSAAERDEYFSAWKASGVTAIMQNAGEEGQDPLRLIKRLARFTYTTDMLESMVSKAVSAADVVAAKQRNRHCLVFTGNGVPLTQHWVSVPDEFRFIRIFYQLGIRMMHVTYNRRNMLGDGCAETSNGGLSDFGRAAIAEMNSVGVIVDVAHCGWQTSLEAAKASSKPMVASHSGCADLHQHIRCKPDNVIRAIVDTGGLVGICCIPSFLGRSHDINAMLDHIDYAVKRFGADHVAIGTDIAYSSRANASEARKLPPRGPSRARFEYFWPPNALSVPHNTTMAWTNWPLFTVGMVQRGHSDSDIQKILGGNVLRVLKAIAPDRQVSRI
ncbi:MAG: membrane dipeptidase [Bryobacterales bacterium]|nr:membrane dipeptidase [Bryobacterales bacterium]